MRTSRIRALAACALLFAAWGGGAPVRGAAPPEPSGATPRPYPPHLQWWARARFGMFIHWGPVSLKGTEISWSRANTNPKCPNKGPIPAEVYDNLYREFNPTKFSADRWVDTARAGGAKYMVLTAKHCDGFLLWHSRASSHSIAASPFRRDICAELAAAARRRGVRIGWYFSPMDWRDPDFRTERHGAFLERMRTELRELLSRYGRIDLLWFDHDGGEAAYDQEATYRLARSLQQGIVINNRLDLGVGQSNRLILSPHADYYTPEQEVGAYDDQRPWESCMTLSARGQWSWGGREDGVKSFEAVLAMLIGCAGGDGNLLLNVGPMPNGEIPPEQAERLMQLGRWLAAYGESIYGTRGGPYKPGEYGASTRKGRTVYVHVREWDDGTLRLPPLPARVLRGRVLGGGRPRVRQTAGALEIQVPPPHRKPLYTVVALELDREATAIPAVEVPARPSLAAGARATASNVFQKMAEYGPDRAVDGSDKTRWATDSGTRQAWLEVDLGRPTAFNRAVIVQAFPELRRVRRFAIERLVDGEWKPCFTGGQLGARLDARFPRVTARRVRLNILESTDGPTIYEFRLFDTAR